MTFLNLVDIFFSFGYNVKISLFFTRDVISFNDLVFLTDWSSFFFTLAVGGLYNALNDPNGDRFRRFRRQRHLEKLKASDPKYADLDVQKELDRLENLDKKIEEGRKIVEVYDKKLAILNAEAEEVIIKPISFDANIEAANKLGARYHTIQEANEGFIKAAFENLGLDSNGDAHIAPGDDGANAIRANQLARTFVVSLAAFGVCKAIKSWFGY